MIVLDRVLGDFSEVKPSAAGREQRREGAGMVQAAGCRAVPRARSGAARDLRDEVLAKRASPRERQSVAAEALPPRGGRPGRETTDWRSPA